MLFSFISFGHLYFDHNTNTDMRGELGAYLYVHRFAETYITSSHLQMKSQRELGEIKLLGTEIKGPS